MTPQRARAIRHVSNLITQYRDRLGWSNQKETAMRFWTERVNSLTKELGVMQAVGEEGEALARRWCKVAGL